MPIFTYKCDKCDIIEERLVNRSEEDVQVCQCDSTAHMSKVDTINGVNFALKGNWYKNNKGY